MKIKKIKGVDIKLIEQIEYANKLLNSLPVPETDRVIRFNKSFFDLVINSKKK